MANKRSKRQKAIVRRRIFLSCCVVLIAAVVALVVFSVNSLLSSDRDGENESSGQSSIISSSENSSETVKETTATVLSTGDIMVHSTQLDGAKTSSGDYDFSAFFKETASYFAAADLSVANLEVTFGGTESGSYGGYPVFNTPDSLADAIKASGLSLLITSNNHSYDTGLFGLKRTAQVLKQKGIEFTGTRETESDPAYLVKEINGIKIGIAVGATARKLTVDVYFGVAVNALEFEDDMLIFPLRRNGKTASRKIRALFLSPRSEKSLHPARSMTDVLRTMMTGN